MAELKFNVPDMDCASCIRAITQAVQRVDAQAQVAADLATKLVGITGAGTRESFGAAIEGAGFSVKG